jgi:hypothetical protein
MIEVVITDDEGDLCAKGRVLYAFRTSASGAPEPTGLTRR